MHIIAPWVAYVYYWIKSRGKLTYKELREDELKNPNKYYYTGLYMILIFIGLYTLGCLVWHLATGTPIDGLET